ncbi:MAG: 50S ribosomal protein L25 [Polyangia bacterium]
MKFTKLEARLRRDTGKGPTRRMRREGLVPAVIYGPGTESVSIAVEPLALTHALSGPLRTNTVLNIDVDDAPAKLPDEIHAIVRDYQYHPVSRELLHVDFFLVDVERAIDVEVPLIAVGRSAGEQLGGTLTQPYRRLPVTCLPPDIPASVEYDITEVELNESVQVKDLSIPEGVEVALEPETTVLAVVTPRALEEEKAEEEDEEGAEGEEAAAEGEKAETSESSGQSE